MKNILLGLLFVLAVIMIYLGITASMLPPALTGIGFLIIALIMLLNKAK